VSPSRTPRSGHRASLPSSGRSVAHQTTIVNTSVPLGIGIGDNKYPRRQSFWITLHHQLRDHEARLVTLLKAARAEAALEDSVSIIRCFDVVAWLVGKRTWTRTAPSATPAAR
jgi:hypothetical protein